MCAHGCRLNGKMTGAVDQVSDCTSVITLAESSVITLQSSDSDRQGGGRGRRVWHDSLTGSSEPKAGSLDYLCMLSSSGVLSITGNLLMILTS